MRLNKGYSMSVEIELLLKSLDNVKNYINNVNEKRIENEHIPIEQFGKHVRSFRKSHKYNQNDFALTIGVSKNLLASIEAGKFSASMTNFIKVAEAIGVEITVG